MHCSSSITHSLSSPYPPGLSFLASLKSFITTRPALITVRCCSPRQVLGSRYACYLPWRPLQRCFRDTSGTSRCERHSAEKAIPQPLLKPHIAKSTDPMKRASSPPSYSAGSDHFTRYRIGARPPFCRCERYHRQREFRQCHWLERMSTSAKSIPLIDREADGDGAVHYIVHRGRQVELLGSKPVLVRLSCYSCIDYEENDIDSIVASTRTEHSSIFKAMVWSRIGMSIRCIVWEKLGPR